MFSPFEGEEKIEGLKNELCGHLRDLIAARKWSQKEAARVLGTSEAQLSRLVRYRAGKANLETLFRYVVTLQPRLQVFISCNQGIEHEENSSGSEPTDGRRHQSIWRSIP